MKESEKPKCPNCSNQNLEYFFGPKDLEVSNGDKEIYLGRINILGCPECRYVDESSIYFS